MPENLARISVLEEQVRVNMVELDKVRDRLHRLEADYSAVTLLADHVKTLKDTIGDLASSVARIATDAAEKAVSLAMQEYDDRQAEKNKVRWGKSIQLITTGVAVGGFIASIVFRVL